MPASSPEMPGMSPGAVPAVKRGAGFLLGLGLLGLAGWAVGGVGALTADNAARPSSSAPRDRTGQRLAAIVAALWPVRLHELAGQDAGLASWPEEDRRYVWLRALLAAGRAEAGAPDRAAVDKRLQTAGREMDAAFSGLVGSRSGSAEPGDRQAGESGEPPCFLATPGGLAWPAKGRLASAFESGRSARQGIALATAEGEPVRAAADGRVVFSGMLRGLGRTVIVAHGLHCHTVYACLAEATVAEGASVAREAELGRAGICPPAGGAGVYFELRFREKALNPAEWFAASP